MMADTRNQQRQHDRVDVQIRTVYQDEINADQSDSLMSNLSLGGCFVSTDRPSPAGSRVRLRFRLDEKSEPIEALGVVRWVKDGEGSGMGVQFEAIKGRDLVALKRFIELKIQASMFG